jgi:hypothetical protein
MKDRKKAKEKFFAFSIEMWCIHLESCACDRDLLIMASKE